MSIHEIPALRATYRVQLDRTFTLHDARAIVPYLERLGISHLYCSPVLSAKPGSTHGYDVIDPACVNPELGGEAALRALADALHERGMGMLVDLVPNHMYAGSANAYWEDVLRHGRQSQWAVWFDVDWAAGDERIVLPVLADDVETLIAGDRFTLDLTAPQPRLAQGASSWPLDPATLTGELELARLDPTAVPDASALIRGDAGRARLRALLDAQHYRLLGWREGAARLNYRRFFDVNDLVGLRQEDERVFDATHATALRLVGEGVIDALRIDHVDGLRDPDGYLARLRAATRRARGEIPIVVEKILSPGETLRAAWPVQGTTGYEFMNDVEDLFLDPDGFAALERSWRAARRLPAAGESFADLAHRAKMSILETSLRPDVARLARLAAAVPALATLAPGAREGALVRLIAALPVYRTYAPPGGAPDAADRRVLERALAIAERRAGRDAQAIDALRALAAVLLDPADDAARALAARFQQTSGPATAKGVEDTALYVYLPLASRNEVGGAPDRPLGDAVERFHAGNAERAARWPSSLLATNTHDTKRSADVRARLDVLAELPAEWRRHVERWRRLNQRHRETVRGRIVPDGNTEQLVYQTLIGIWPAPRAARRADDLPDRAWRDGARARLVEYTRKAVREAKRHTSWTAPNADYEAALERFIGGIMTPGDDAPFLTDVARLVARISGAGERNALARILLHLTSPGVPDLYRGDELWFLALVDPDNRRPVDFDARTRALDEVERSEGWPDEGGAAAAATGGDAPVDAQVKLATLRRLLHTRRAHSALFARGSYRPLECAGAHRRHVVAFARELEGAVAIAAIARFPLALEELRMDESGEVAWEDTRILIPSELSGRRFASALDREPATLLDVASSVDASRLFSERPFALLLSPRG